MAGGWRSQSIYANFALMMVAARFFLCYLAFFFVADEIIPFRKLCVALHSQILSCVLVGCWQPSLCLTDDDGVARRGYVLLGWLRRPPPSLRCG